MAVYGYTKNYKLVKPQFDSDTWHDYEYDNLDTIDAVLSAIYASGDWQGFWKTNTSYTAGSVVIDRDTDTMYKVLQDHTTDSSTFNEYYTAHPDYYRLWSPNNLAEDWAIKMDGDVETGEYSAKAHASSESLVPTGSAKEWAIGSGEVGSSGEYSAKKYATDAHNDYISLTTNANVVAVGSNINNVNATGQSISNVNTLANNISDVNTAALNIEAIKDAPNQANAASQSASDASQSATNAANSATSSANSANASAASANNSHIWAEGTDAQVQALGGVHSSKVWAQQSTNANIALTNSPYTTNRILEIPQDIKLELNNGTLTLKAGSKVYVPNGFESDGTTPKFDYMTLESDKVVGQAGTVTGAFALYRSDNGTCYSVAPFGISSGATAPSSPVTTATWYDTTNNVIKVYNGTNWVSDVAFPLCIFSNSNSLVTSIDQVFNGFGYIGSTVFALPGVKLQTPNGRNEDGTYKTLIRTIDSVRTYDAGVFVTRNLNISFNGDVDSILFGCLATDWFTYNKKFSSDTLTYSYDEYTGLWWYSPDQSSWSQISVNIVGSCRVESGKITSFEPYTVDSVVNSNASNFSQAGRSYLSGLGMPSNRYIDLTLGASGSTYTAPANGTVLFIKRASAVGQSLGLKRVSSNIFFDFAWSSVGDSNIFVNMNVRKGEVFGVEYTASGTETQILRFYYAEGDQ